MSTVFVGEVHPSQGDPDNLFAVRELVLGVKAAGPIADSGRKLQWPA